MSTPARHQRVALIGMMGSGKTTLGRAVATELGIAFIDADEAIEADAGCTIPEIFEREGEAGFRERERSVIARIASEAAAHNQALIFALGGGAYMSDAVRESLREAGFATIYIHASPEVSLQRAGDDPGDTRPMLQSPDVLQRLRDLYTQRDPVYRNADYFIQTDHFSVAASSQKLRDLIA